MKTVNQGHRQRMRERFLSEGIHNLAEHEVLEMILYMCIPYKDTNKIAHNLITSLGGLSAVLDAPVSVLARIGGISTTSATNIKLIRQVWERYKVSLAGEHTNASVKDISKHASIILNSSRHEQMIVYYVDGSTRCVGHELYTGDGQGSIYVNNKEILTAALGYNASGVVIVHNHPTANSKPSVMDIKYTQGLYNSLKGIDVVLLDHIVIGSDGNHSMASHKQMDTIREKYNQ